MKIIFILFLVLMLKNSDSYSQDISSKELSNKIEQATMGDSESALWLSMHYRKSGAKKEAIRWLKTAAKLGSIPAIVELGYEKPYIAESELKCGGYTVHASTSCRSIDKALGQPICYAQHLEFSDGKKNKDFFMFNSSFRLELMVATEMTCINNGLHHWLVVYSTNFGNGQSCFDCERLDYFDDSANYLGSSSSETGSKIVIGYRKISKHNEMVIDVLMKDKRRINSIDINRYPSVK